MGGGIRPGGPMIVDSGWHQLHGARDESARETKADKSIKDRVSPCDDEQRSGDWVNSLRR